MKGYKQGLYKPNHPEKYIGDINKIVYRSSWEYRFNQFLDGNPSILKWGSECVAIPYIKPTDNKIHKYFPDYFVIYRDKSGEIHQELVEVKPISQTKITKRSNLYEQLTYAVNVIKWQSAKKWCEGAGKQTGRKTIFRIVTEKELFA